MEFRAIYYSSQCECCGDDLVPGRAIWLERSQLDGRYYTDLPAGHASDGAYPFRRLCALRILGQAFQVHDGRKIR